MIRRLLFFTFSVSLLTVTWTANAQITNVTNSTSTPTPGSGHDYLKALNETVDPANGSVSIRIGTPVPKGRGLTIPFSFAYDSNGAFTLHSVNGTANFNTSTTSPLTKDGWSYATPLLTSAFTTKLSHTANGQPVSCGIYYGYVFEDPSGGRHALHLATTYSDTYCHNATYASGGDDFVKASFDGTCPTTSGSYCSAGIRVVTEDGTVFHFPSPSGNSSPDFIEDRNGNVAGCCTDTLGRTAVSWSGFGASGNTVTIAGLGAPYSLTWGSTSFSFGVNAQQSGTNGGCGGIVSASGSHSDVTTLQLPNNGQHYTFYYGTNPDPTYSNPYGLISEIDYPTGGWVKYQWAKNTRSEFGVFPDATGNASGCKYTYDWPAVSHRYVSFDGSTIAEQQDFAYSVNWNSGFSAWVTKQTTVTTHDLKRGTSFQTQYVYTPVNSPTQPYELDVFAAQIPVESTVTYKDWNGSTLKTVTKTWLDQYRMGCESTALPNGQISRTDYAYQVGLVVSDKKEWDWGQAPACGSSATGAALRETTTAFQSFANTPIYPSAPSILDRPSSEITYGSGTKVAETDYFYDQTAVSPVSNLVSATHDETNYAAASVVPRGNATQTIQWLSGGTSPATTYTYDETGQVLSVTDPCGSTTCTNMTGTAHTTTYSYSDAFTTLSGGSNVAYTPPNGATNAYLTQVTDPLLHVSKFTYDYNNGQLTSFKDPNDVAANRAGTTYIYNDSFSRPTQITTPDGGQTTLAYSDASYSPSANTPSVTTTRKITSSLNEVNISATDGIGHVVRTIVNTDPDGADTTDTTYDGSGRVLTQSNPHRSASAPSDGKTTYVYDALGRATSVTKQDASVTTTYYDQTSTNTSSTCTSVVDEAGKMRKSCSDGLGRLVEVDEPGSTTSSGTPGTGTITVSGSPQVVQLDPCVYPAAPCPHPQYNNGTVSVTINGYTASATYGGPTDTAAIVASRLATSLNGSGSPVGAVASGNLITVTAKTVGTSTNYSISSSATWNTQYFSSSDFAATSPGMSGGTDASLGANPLVTLYSYDVLNNVTCVVQKGTDTSGFTTCAAAPSMWRARSFVYDTLSRLTSDTNPESGTLTYTYDANGNVATKVAPLPNKIPADTSSPQTVSTTYSYDVLNRLTKKTYSNGTATAQYAYDGNSLSGCSYAVPTLSDTNPIGRRTGMCDASGATHWALNLTSGTGWKITEARNITGTTQTSAYQNNFGGMLYQLTYPTGRVVTYGASGAGRYLSAVDSANSLNYAQNATYAPFGGLLTMTNGSAPITVTNAYNSRLQPATLSAATGANTIISHTYDFHVGTGDNGNIYQSINNVDNSRNQSFTYDALNRIATAQSAATSGAKCWGESFTIDTWGNLTNKATTKCTAELLNAPATTKNQISGYCYDLAGNMLGATACPSLPYSPTYTYDAENRMTTGGGCTFVYDGDGNRVQKLGCATMYYFLDLGGNMLEEAPFGTPSREYIFFNGQRIARRDVSTPNTVHYFFSDDLGSTSVVTNANGALPPESESDYFPYGGEIVVTSPTIQDQNYKFTGKERDSQTGLDNFEARYYTSGLGRFMTPDWAERPTAVPYAVFGDPQTLNLYTYVENAPVNRVDATGHGSQCKGDHNSSVCIGDEGRKEEEEEKVGVDSTVKKSAFLEYVKGEASGLVEYGKQVFDLLSVTPYVGPFFATGSASVSASQGNTGEAAGSTALAALSVVPGGGVEQDGVRVVSSIGKDAKLVKYAEEAGSSVQKGLDHLVEQLGKGNMNPGLGTKSIGDGISYARARDGARVFFRQSGNTIDILAKASKANEAKVINYLKSLQ